MVLPSLSAEQEGVRLWRVFINLLMKTRQSKFPEVLGWQLCKYMDDLRTTVWLSLSLFLPLLPLFLSLPPLPPSLSLPLHMIETLAPEHVHALASGTDYSQADYSQDDKLGLQYTPVNFGDGKSPGSPDW